MKILLTNDDGVHARGLRALYHCFESRHEVAVVAPDRERSAIGHAISLNRPLRSMKVAVNCGRPAVAVNGTPADCVKFALLEVAPSPPDLVTPLRYDMTGEVFYERLRHRGPSLQ